MSRSPDSLVDGFRIDEGDETVHLASGPVRLTPKAFQVLRCLAGAGGRLVTKDALMDAVWPDAHVTESALSVTIVQLRDALGDDARQPRYVQTVHRRGFRWIGPAPASVATPPEPSGQPRNATSVTADPRIVGRDDALARLLSQLDATDEGTRQVVFVTGEAGIGKTTVVDAFCSALAGRGALVARGQCIDSYGEGEPYMPVLEAVETLCRSDGSVIASVKQVAPSWLQQIPGLVDAAERSDLARILAGSTRERMIREFARFVEEVARERSVVIVLEDLHWSDASTLALLAAIAQRRERARLMLVATLRPVDAIARRSPVAPLRRELVARRAATEIALGALCAADVGGYLAARFGEHRFPSVLAEVLLELTAGNPLFVVTAVDELLERRRLVQEHGVWTSTASPDELADEVPDGVRAAVEIQIDRAGDEDRALLEAAAIAGMRFAVQAVAAAVGSTEAAVETRCETVAHATGLVHEAGTDTWPDGTVGRAFAFRHALHRQVILARVGAARRRASHLAIAERLESAYGARASEVAGALALHFEIGGDATRAVKHRIAAARVSVARLAHEEAIEHLHRGLELLGAIDDTGLRDASELALRSAMLAPSYAAAGAASEEVEDHARRVGELTAAAGPRVETFMALGAMFGVTASRAQLVDAESIARRAHESASGVEWGALHALAARGQVGLCLSLRGRLADALPELDAAAALPDLVPLAPLELSLAYSSDAAVARWLLGHPARARADSLQSAGSAEASRHPPTMAYVLANRLRFGLLHGDRDIVHSATAAIRGVAEESGVERWRGLAMIGEGWLASFEAPGGDTAIAEGIAILEAFGSRVYSPFYGCARADALLRHDRPDEAAEVVAMALSTAHATGETWCEAELRRLAARAAATRGEREREGMLRNALSVAADQGASWWRLRVALDLAGLLGGGDREVAATLEASLAPWKTEAGLPEVTTATALLAAHGSSPLRR